MADSESANIVPIPSSLKLDADIVALRRIVEMLATLSERERARIAVFLANKYSRM